MDLLLYKVAIIFRNPYPVFLGFSGDKCIVSISWTINLGFPGDLKYSALSSSYSNRNLFKCSGFLFLC